MSRARDKLAVNTAEVRKATAEAREKKERDLTQPCMSLSSSAPLRVYGLDMDLSVIREAKVSAELAKWHLKFNGQGEAPAIETAETMDSEAAADFEDA